MKSASIRARIVTSIAFGVVLAAGAAVASHPAHGDKLGDHAKLVKLDPKGVPTGAHLAKLDSHKLGEAAAHGVKGHIQAFPALAKLHENRADKLGDAASHTKLA